MSERPDVLIVGAGLAGLACARHLTSAGIECGILEAGDQAGGRVRTDRVQGFLLDRGFQVLLTAYPEARRILDLGALDLRSFRPGALVMLGDRRYRLADPWRRPGDAWASLISPLGGLGDKIRVARLRARVRAGSLAELWQRPERTTRAALEAAGFSPEFIHAFFRPFLGGVFLDAELETSSRMLEFVFRMFSAGDAAVPAAGMEAIPAQMAAALEPGSIRTGARVEKVAPGAVTLASGEEMAAGAVVIATEAPEASRLLGIRTPRSRGVTTLYYAADTPLTGESVLILNGDGAGSITHLAEMSAVAPSYAPAGRALIGVTVLGSNPLADHELDAIVRAELVERFGPLPRTWQLLRVYRIEHALPDQTPPALGTPQRPVRVTPGLYVAGDHRDNASIDGALTSGRRAAEAVRTDLGR